MDELLEHFRKMHAYDAEANELTMAALKKTASGRGTDWTPAERASFQRALDTLAHVHAARRLWLSRLGAAQAPTGGVFPRGEMQRIDEEAAVLDGLWKQYLRTLDSESLSGDAVYTSTERVRFSTPVRDILAHVVNHCSYHRGQIASLIARCGGDPPLTDYIFFARKGG